MSRDFNYVERRERGGLGGRRNWDSVREGYDPYSRNRVTRGAGWESSPATSYREADPREFSDRDDWDDDDRDDWDRSRRYRQQPVNWGRGRDDERRQMSRGYDLDQDVYRAGDRDEWRGEFGPKEDRTQWGRDRDRDWRESGGEPNVERRYSRSDDDRFGSMDDVRVRYGRDYDRYAGWSRDTTYGRRTDDPRSEEYRDRDWDRAGRRDGETQRFSGRTQGQFAGRGPRGYQRSDERIREDVSELLWDHDDIDASDIDVTVQNGEVTLEGTVDSRWTKRMAEDVAHNARGVIDVHNRLRIQREQSGGWVRGSDMMTRSTTRTTQQGAVSGNVMLEGGRVGTGLAFAPDMQVVGSEGDEVGIVKEVRADTILVDRPMSRDVYIPFSAVNVTDGSTARLNIRSDEVDNQDWQNPPMTGTDTDYDESVQLT